MFTYKTKGLEDLLYSNLYAQLVYLTKRNDITHVEIGRHIGLDKGAIIARAKRNSKFKKEEIEKIEKAFNINFSNSEISDFKKRKKPEEKIIKNWGQKIQKLRAENNLTVSEFASLTGIEEEKLINYINDNKEPDVNDLIKIINNFNVTMEELLF